MTDQTALNSQVAKAVKALLKHESSSTEKKALSSKKNLLIEDDEASNSAFWLVFGLDKIPEVTKVKPIKLAVKHAWKVSDDEGLNVCLITKDPHSQYKEMIRPLGLKSVSKIMGVSKLRTDYKPFEVRRQLCNGYDLFLADERILPLLPKLLGKTFFEKKKLPIPVDLSKKKPEALKKELKEAIESTVLNLVSGPCTSVKIGLASQTASQLKDNAEMVIEQTVKKIPGGWNNIRSIHIKTGTSISLPIYAPEQ